MDELFRWARLGIALGGLLFPGYFLATLLRSPEKLVSSFCLSLVVLFQSIFWLDVCGCRLGFGSVLAAQAAVTALAGLSARRWPPAPAKAVLPPTMGCGWLRWLTGLILVAATLLILYRSTRTPLSGFDTPFRWNFLALQIFKKGNFDFYPPRTPADFRSYFYVDGIPPLVSFSYWWLYAAAGRPLAWLTGLLVTAQLLLAALTAFRLARCLHSEAAGDFAVAVLLGSPLFLWAVVMGQETGLTALGLGASLYFVVEAAQAYPLQRMILAGLTAAVGALAREYGCAFLFCGIFAAWWLGIRARHQAAFVAVAVLAVGPWYLRNWLLTGNPFYSNPVGPFFPVNPVHVGLLNAYREVFSSYGPTPATLGQMLAAVAPAALLLGLAASVLLWRRLAFLATAAAVMVLLWLYSLPVTAAGPVYSMRVLSPALLLWSVLAGVLTASLSRPAWLKYGLAALVFLGSAWALSGLSSLTPSRSSADRYYDELENLLEATKGRLLSDDAYTGAGLVARGVDVVPVWSPEVRFLFDNAESGETMRRKLFACGIRVVEFHPHRLNARYLQKSPFYAQALGHCKILLQGPDLLICQLSEDG